MFLTLHRLEVEVKVGWRGLSWCGSGLLQQQLASWVRAADPGLFTYSPLEQEVDTHLNPTPAHVGRGARQHTGQATCFDLSSALGPWDPRQ
ncbi:hypothetical protein PBY51_011887 [Eleginops maclovinus]|uniref:Uncharacterized protein n=1 Tax=Eleginops maclovinus TaxID=56733 RepID=A0AAN7XV34_ELEMC|nr:hypothetical protein PBY51_011887 [Eleginops maclovinus]